jgi:uncharacterized protein YxjI
VKVSYTFISMADPFTITDDSGQVRYQVTTMDYGERLSLRDASGRELAAVVHGRHMHGVQVRINGEEAAMVRARWPLLARWRADMPSGSLRTRGDVYYDYSLYPDSDYSKATVFVSRMQNWSRLHTKINLIIADREDDPVLLTAIVLAVEHLIYERGDKRMRARP